MKQKVSDYIADFFAQKEIDHIFTVVGGGAMHMNDSFGHHPQIKCIYNHHEQASAMAAEAYYRVKHKMAGLCVTSGPGAINALNGVAGAYQDSIPMIVVSGQTKTALMTCNSGLNLRTLGNQEFEIVSALSKMTKFAISVMDPQDIRLYLEMAFFIATDGRPGPCWLDIPVDVQGAFVETDSLRGYEEKTVNTHKEETIDELNLKIATIIDHLQKAKRPVIYAGNGVRISGAQEELLAFSHKCGIPVVTCWDSIDLIETENECYGGRAGIMGDRFGNFAVQNSDLLLAIGNRLNIYQVGYQLESWAREAYVVDVDIDETELQKKTIRVDLPICCDAKRLINQLSRKINGSESRLKQSFSEWREQCNIWKKKYPVVSERHYEQKELVNVYAFIDMFSKALPQNTITVVANGSASVVGSAAYFIKKNDRFIMNCAMSSMGYDLPAAVGACVANNRNAVICIAGDGSVMMNLQELQTIVTNQLPVKILLLNNEGYHQIRLTQTNLFEKNYVGIGPESKDLSFPQFERIAYAFGFPYKRCVCMEEVQDTVEWINQNENYCIAEICCSIDQIFEPKSATKRLEDGSLYSSPLEDLYPFLSREELKENMYIKLWDER